MFIPCPTSIPYSRVPDLANVACEQSFDQKEGNILLELVSKPMESNGIPICVHNFWNSKCSKEVELQCGFSLLENTLRVPTPVTEFSFSLTQKLN